MNRYESYALEKIFGEEKGHIAERDYLGEIDNSEYIKLIKEAVITSNMIESLSSLKGSNDPVGLLLEFKEEIPKDIRN